MTAPTNLRELLIGRTQREAALLVGVSETTMRTWLLRAGIVAGFRCVICKEHKPRDAFINVRRCTECHEAIQAGTLQKPKLCKYCNKIKPFDQFFLKNRKKNPVANSTCKACSMDRARRLKETVQDGAGAIGRWSSVSLSSSEGRLHYWPQRIEIEE